MINTKLKWIWYRFYSKLWRGDGSYMSYESWGPENPYPSPNGQNMLCCVGIKSTNGLSCEGAFSLFTLQLQPTMTIQAFHYCSSCYFHSHFHSSSSSSTTESLSSILPTRWWFHNHSLAPCPSATKYLKLTRTSNGDQVCVFLLMGFIYLSFSFWPLKVWNFVSNRWLVLV